MLFYDDRLRQWNARNISSVSAARKGTVGGSERWIHDIEFNSGEAITVLDVTVNEIARLPAHVLPAEPGYKAITGGDDEGTFMEPVIGWAVNFLGEVRPITIDGINCDVDYPLPIVRPDGKVQVPGKTTYDSVDEYVESLKS